MLLGSTIHSVPWLEGPSWPLTPSSPCGLASAEVPWPLQCLQLVKSPPGPVLSPFFGHALWEVISCILAVSGTLCPQALRNVVESCTGPRNQPVGPVSKAPTIHLGDTTPVSMGSLRSPMTFCTQQMAPSYHRVITAVGRHTRLTSCLLCLSTRPVCTRQLSPRTRPS